MLRFTVFMDIKKSNFLEDRFELSSFSLKIYNVNAGNQTARGRGGTAIYGLYRYVPLWVWLSSSLL